jgi:hypothetical protein
LLEEAEIAAKLDGIVSHETQLKVLSIVDNVEDELDKIEEENEAAEETIVDKMMFPNTPGNTEGVNDDESRVLE